MPAPFARVLGACALAIALATPAHAQLGKLLNKTKEQTVDKQVDKATWVPQPAPAFDNTVLEITEARYAKVKAGLQAEIAAAPTALKDAEAAQADHERAQKQYEADKKAYDRKHDDWEKCNDGIRNKYEGQAKQIEALARAGKYQESAAAATKLQQDMQNAATACGTEPEEPKSPGLDAATPYDMVQKKGQQASGFDAMQWRIIRERTINYAQYDGRPTMGFSKNELGVLGGHKDELKGILGDMKKSNVPL